ncbi:PREDICTED: putative nuclear matrix constituent protein 1-like protein [Fragaria vesca subsp. vesca]|uniref:putative nuclear matrix constituent protein 1-like protein n=1 Tax=Fragaria vesca subsp. vesca TaxID=101020 RepID=UPI0002C37786|nr:PREDICTED: putative nuclear matrix constituent protein 1-like protein [Fragaria vesca subsp. vesca]
MASPRSARTTTPGSGRALSITPGARVLQSPVSDEAIWKRLREAGFDEESIKRRDKAALIAYISKLEAEIFDHQHHMGLLILEKKRLNAEYEKLKASSETAELRYNREQAAHASALAEARKREERLKKAVGVKEECIASIEKSMHEMRAESAETKVAAESKLVEARNMLEDAQKKFTEAEGKLLLAESLQAEASRYHRVAERKMVEVEAREDDLRRNILSFKTDCEEKEKEISLERKSLSERQKSLQQEQDRLLDAQALLNQREDIIFGRSQELDRLEKELEDLKLNIGEERKALNDHKFKVELTETSLANREEALNRREALLNKKEQELLVFQEKLASKESDEIKKAVAIHEVDLKKKKSEFEAELEVKRKLIEAEIETKRRAWELREVDLNQREDLLQEKEYDLEVQLRSLVEREKEVSERSNLVDEKENSLRAAEKELEQNNLLLQKEKEENIKLKLELQHSLDSLEEKKKQLEFSRQEFEVLKTETSELSDLEMKLKEEVDLVRSQKQELMAEAEKLAAEKAKFESEWESLDDKREMLRKEAECLAEERLAFSKFIKEEHDNLKQEKDEMRDQYKRDAESLVVERQDFMNNMARERSELFSKLQQERADFLLEIDTRRRELEDCIDKKHEELECSLKEKEVVFEQEKKNQLEYIRSLNEKAAKEMEEVASERKRLETERVEINVDRERRNQEWAELTNSIEELKIQREKLKKQRELLHTDSEEIHRQIEQLKELESLKVALDAEVQRSDSMPGDPETSTRYLKQATSVNDDPNSHGKLNVANSSNPSVLKAVFSPPSSARFTWLKRCTELVFKQSPEKQQLKYEESPVISQRETGLKVTEQMKRSSKSNGHSRYLGNGHSSRGFSKRPNAFGEPKVIVEVPVGENVKATNDSEHESTHDSESAGERRASLMSDKVVPGGRKRRVEKSYSDDCFDPLLETSQNIKKRRQDVGTVDSSEHAITPCIESTQTKVVEQHLVSLSSDQIYEGALEDSVLVVDKVIKVSEVICERTETQSFTNEGSFANEDNIATQNSVGEPQHESNGVLTSDPKAQQKMQELDLGNVGLVNNDHQLQEKDISKKHLQAV